MVRGMRESQPSFTANAIAFWRGVAGIEEPQLAPDAVAEQLVPAPYRQALGLVRRLPRASALLRLADRAARGRIRHMAFRTRAIDDVIAAGMDAGMRQVVVLGAGLDARAWRLGALRDAIVFEVDHPATQAHKRARLSALAGVRQCAREVRFVGVDLERDGLRARLAAAGHDRAQPSVLVCEGVLMYLRPEAVEARLRDLSALAAEGSLLAASYCVVPGRDAVTEAVLLLAGEPMHTRLDPPEMAALLARHGFTVMSDAGDHEWARSFEIRPGVAGSERLMVARRHGCSR